MNVFLLAGTLSLSLTLSPSYLPQPPAKEEVVVGYIADIRVTGKNERTFWEVPEGKDAVTLTKNKEDERLSYVCIWEGAPPAKCKPGAKVQVVGVYTGNTTAGARIYVGCRLKE